MNEAKPNPIFTDAEKKVRRIDPVEVYFELGRYKMRKSIYHPEQLAELTEYERRALPALSKNCKLTDDLIGAELLLHEKAFEGAINELFKRGNKWYRWKRHVPTLLWWLGGNISGALYFYLVTR
jgi:hypothetical protein